MAPQLTSNLYGRILQIRLQVKYYIFQTFFRGNLYFKLYHLGVAFVEVTNLMIGGIEI